MVDALKEKLGPLFAPTVLFWYKLPKDNVRWNNIRSGAGFSKDDPNGRVIEYALGGPFNREHNPVISADEFYDLVDDHKWFLQMIDNPSGGFKASEKELVDVEKIIADTEAKRLEFETKVLEKKESEDKYVVATLKRSDVETRLIDKLDVVHNTVQEGTKTIVDSVNESTVLLAGLSVAQVISETGTPHSSTTIHSSDRNVMSMTIIAKVNDKETFYRITDTLTIVKISCLIKPDNCLYTDS
jgi:hypothetical protein